MTRLRDWPLTTSPSSGDVLIIDGTNGTRTVSFQTLKDKINENVAIGGGSSSEDGSSNPGAAAGAKAYVTQTGFDGSFWYWRAWSDGTRECWSIGRTEQHTSDDNCLYSYSVSFPWTFDNPPAIAASVVAGNDIFSRMGYTRAFNNHVEGYVVSSWPNQTLPYYVSFYAIGKVSSSS